jgi:lipopolysaccharide transport system ATP-binding protein
MSGASIVVNGLSKAYPRNSNNLASFATAMIGRPFKDSFWAVDNVSFELKPGATLGIVGRNGSGKSTLLQLICGTVIPTSGSVTVNGRVAAMLELGAGFNPDFTGRENVFLAASVYGLSDAQIEERFASIEAFADIGSYIERPVSEYSSGMYARLAFAVCAHVDAEILVVDEILGVGDAAFQRKCQRFMQEFRQRGTLLFVSHDPNAVISACETALWLEDGKAMAMGRTEDVLARYISASAEAAYDDTRGTEPEGPVHQDLRFGDRNVIAVSPFDPNCASHGYGGARITDCYFSSADGDHIDRLRGGETVTLHIRAKVSDRLASPIFGFMFRNALGQNLFGDNTFLAYREHPPVAEAETVLEAQLQFRMPYLPAGDYTVAPSIIAGTQSNHIAVNWLEDAVILSVRGEAVRHGKIGATMHGFRMENVPA